MICAYTASHNPLLQLHVLNRSAEIIHQIIKGDLILMTEEGANLQFKKKTVTPRNTK